MARKPHVAYFAGMRYLPLPYTESIPEFIARAQLAHADYLFYSAIEGTLAIQLSALADPDVSLPGLRPLASGGAGTARAFVLYRFVPDTPTPAEMQDSVLAVVRRYAARRPGQAWPALYLGGELVTSGLWREALGPLAEAERLDPSEPLVARFQAIALEALGDHEGAAAACERGIRVAPDGTWERAFLGHVRNLQGRYAEARELLRAAVAAAPANAEYASELARATRAADSVAASGARP